MIYYALGERLSLYCSGHRVIPSVTVILLAPEMDEAIARKSDPEALMDPRFHATMGKTGQCERISTQLTAQLGCLRGFGGIVGHHPRARISVFSDNRVPRADRKPRASIVMCEGENLLMIRRSVTSDTTK